MTSLALITDPDERVRLARMRTVMQRLDAAPVREREIQALVAEGYGRRGTLIRQHDAWRREGDSALVDKRRLRVSTRNPWLSVYREYCERDQLTSLGAWRRMMADLRSGRHLDGVGTWQDVWRSERRGRALPERCPIDWIPRGASYSVLQRHSRRCPDHRFALTASRQGLAAARQYMLPVLKTRLGLRCGQVYEYDDKWHNVDVLLDGSMTNVRALEFCGYDVSSAHKIAYAVRPRVPTSSGRRDSLKELEFRFLFAHILTDIGIHRDGSRHIVEHGTAAIRPKHEERIRAIPTYGELITFDRSGIMSEQVHAGMFKGDKGGSFRFKALTEGSHTRDHRALAAMPGQVGQDVAHKPESHAALIRYHQALEREAAHLPEETRALLQVGMLTWSQYLSAYGQIMHGLADDWNHALEGWDPETRTVVEWRAHPDSNDWHSVRDLLAMTDTQRAALAALFSAHPDCRRARPMSRREAWEAGQSELVRVPLVEMPMLLMPEDARRATVNDNGTISFADQMYYGRDRQVYRADAVRTRAGYTIPVAPGHPIAIYWTPYHPEHIWLIDAESGREIGMAPRYERAPVYDRDAILRAAGQQNADLARKILPIRGRHQAEAEDRARMMGHNADVIAGRITPVGDDETEVPDAIERAPETFCSIEI